MCFQTLLICLYYELSGFLCESPIIQNTAFLTRRIKHLSSPLHQPKSKLQDKQILDL